MLCEEGQKLKDDLANASIRFSDHAPVEAKQIQIAERLEIVAWVSDIVGRRNWSKVPNNRRQAIPEGSRVRPIFLSASSTMPSTFAWGYSDVYSGTAGSDFVVDRLGHLEKGPGPPRRIIRTPFSPAKVTIGVVITPERAFDSPVQRTN